MNFKRMNVFASKEEIEYSEHCTNMPILGITNPEPPGPGVPAVIPMCESPQEATHKYALAHDLPEIQGYYGIDLTNGEFIKT